jgi:hypothetical protein
VVEVDVQKVQAVPLVLVVSVEEAQVVHIMEMELLLQPILEAVVGALVIIAIHLELVDQALSSLDTQIHLQMLHQSPMEQRLASQDLLYIRSYLLEQLHFKE